MTNSLIGLLKISKMLFHFTIKLKILDSEELKEKAHKLTNRRKYDCRSIDTVDWLSVAKKNHRGLARERKRGWGTVSEGWTNYIEHE